MPLVVLGAARNDDLPPVGMVGDGRFEGRTVPKTERIDRLHVVVTVEQHVRPARTAAAAVGFGNDRGMTGRRPDVCGQTQRCDVFGKVIGSRLAISGKGRIGRNRFDPQQRKQPLEAVVEIGIDAVEDRL